MSILRAGVPTIGIKASRKPPLRTTLAVLQILNFLQTSAHVDIYFDRKGSSTFSPRRRIECIFSSKMQKSSRGAPELRVCPKMLKRSSLTSSASFSHVLLTILVCLMSAEPWVGSRGALNACCLLLPFILYLNETILRKPEYRPSEHR